MTQADHTKVLKQIQKKPGKYAKYKKYSIPKERDQGKYKKRCRMTGATRGVIHKYGINLCRKTFRQFATKLGFKKYS
ncbi:30S ribosomal protein S14 [Candidatus Woesearchaeota archaeon]|nr:30S ribosomal protein S14 [Candidatus Woesearchaeota archaeon]